VTRTEYDGSITVILDRFEGKRLNSPNDVVRRRQQCRSDVHRRLQKNTVGVDTM
jgi:hypothetical protein